jgi:hypothetical protein
MRLQAKYRKYKSVLMLKSFLLSLPSSPAEMGVIIIATVTK